MKLPLKRDQVEEEKLYDYDWDRHYLSILIYHCTSKIIIIKKTSGIQNLLSRPAKQESIKEKKKSVFNDNP